MPMKILARIALNKVSLKQLLMPMLLLLAFPSVAQEATKALSVQYAPGMVVQLIAPVTDPEKRHLRDLYFKKNAETAQRHGYRQDGVLIIEETLVGDFKPNVFVISHWPSLKAQKTFQALPLFSGVKSLRRDAWEALKLYDHELDVPLKMTFTEDKAYTVALAWTNPSNPSEYYDYMAALPPLLEKVGGRFMHQFNDVVVSAHNPDELAPQQITFVEWDSKDGVEKLQALPEFAELAKKLQSGTVRFELHRVTPRLQ